jgi:transcriptional regulator with XRE-family HTH domain
VTAVPDIDPRPLPTPLGSVIREARERREMRQVDLAAAVHVGLSAISGWERGTQSPSATVLPLLAAALRVRFVADPEHGWRVEEGKAPAAAPVVIVAGTAEAMREALDRAGVPRAQ